MEEADCLEIFKCILGEEFRIYDGQIYKKLGVKNDNGEKEFRY